MLVIQVEYLTGSVCSALGRGSAPEWPPHPWRLFSALVAACFESRMGESALNTLRWLENQGPPLMQVGAAGTGRRAGAFVPTNYPAKNGSTLPWERSRQPRFFPSFSPDPPIVYFLWGEADPDTGAREQLDDIARRVGYLGKSTSLVRMRVVDGAPAPNYIPDQSGRHLLRVAEPGTLAELGRLYAASGWEPSSAPKRRYAKLDESGVSTEPIQGPFGDLVILRRVGGASLGSESTLTLTSAARKAVISLAEKRGWLTPLLHGHGGGAHCAWLPLPFAGWPHADGRILGLALAIPRGAEHGERTRAVFAASSIRTIHLPEPLRPWEVEVAEPETEVWTLDPDSWRGPASTWSTVTPILLDRFPKRKCGVQDILGASCERAGLPPPVGIEHGPYPLLKEGVPPVPEFRLFRRPGDPPRWAVHATLTFPSPVLGPIVMGAGRYFGLGLLRPMRGEREA
jgi:CRISPR-associated protein Csb2